MVMKFKITIHDEEDADNLVAVLKALQREGLLGLFDQECDYSHD